MSKPKLLGSIIVFGALSVVLIALLWWRYSVDEKLGYCQTPEQTCINRQGFALGEPWPKAQPKRSRDRRLGGLHSLAPARSDPIIALASNARPRSAATTSATRRRGD